MQTFQFNSVQAESLPRKKTAFILIHLNVDSYERRKKICIAKKNRQLRKLLLMIFEKLSI